MKKEVNIKNLFLAVIVAGMTLSYNSCSKDGGDDNPTPDKQEQNKDTNQNPSGENQDNNNQNQDNNKQNQDNNNQNQGGENVSKFKIKFVVAGASDKITLSETTKEAVDGETVNITYELQEGFAIYNVESGDFDTDAKTISAYCNNADEEVTITVKSIYHKVTVSLSFDDGTTEVVSEDNYKKGDEIVYELDSKYKGYYITFVSVSDPSMGRHHDDNKAKVTLDDINVCKADFDIYQGNKKVSTLSVNKMELNKEYELDLTDLMNGYDFKEIKSYDNIDAKVENGKLKVTVTQNYQYSASVYLEKAKFPAFTDSKQSILGKTFVAWSKGISFEKNSDGIVMNYYEKVNGKVEKTQVYTFVKYDDWTNIFTCNNIEFEIYIDSEGENEYKLQKTESVSKKTEFLSLSEVASVDEMISTILNNN